MDNTMALNEVDKDNSLGSLVPLNSWTSDLKVANSSSLYVFMLGGCGGLGFFEPLCFHHTFKSLETLSDFMHTFSPEVVKPLLYLCFSLL